MTLDPRYELIHELRAGLAVSRSVDRKRWTALIVERGITLESLLSLLHGETKTAQRFMWLIGDLADDAPQIVAPMIGLLFSLRNEMPFPGMRRSVAKWLLRTGTPNEIERPAIRQLLAWLDDPDISIGCKSYSASALFELAINNRLPKARLIESLEIQAANKNRAYGKRMRKLLERLRDEPK